MCRVRCDEEAIRVALHVLVVRQQHVDSFEALSVGALAVQDALTLELDGFSRCLIRSLTMRNNLCGVSARRCSSETVICAAAPAACIATCGGWSANSWANLLLGELVLIVDNHCDLSICGGPATQSSGVPLLDFHSEARSSAIRRPIRVMCNRCPVLIKRAAADGAALRRSRAAHLSGATLRMFVNARARARCPPWAQEGMPERVLTTRRIGYSVVPAGHRWCRPHGGQQPRAAQRKVEPPR